MPVKNGFIQKTKVLCLELFCPIKGCFIASKRKEVFAMSKLNCM